MAFKLNHHHPFHQGGSETEVFFWDDYTGEFEDGPLGNYPASQGPGTAPSRETKVSSQLNPSWPGYRSPRLPKGHQEWGFSARRAGQTAVVVLPSAVDVLPTHQSRGHAVLPGSESKWHF